MVRIQNNCHACGSALRECTAAPAQWLGSAMPLARCGARYCPEGHFITTDTGRCPWESADCPFPGSPAEAG
jgi:hypothetical protein